MKRGSRLITTIYQCSRVIEDREPSPSATILDSHSVKTATLSAVEVGDDAAKRIKGRKRHLLVDSLGLVLIVVVTAASVPERAGAKLVFAQLERVRHGVNRLVLIWVDGGYRGEDFMRWVMDTHGWIMEFVTRAGARKGFVPLPRRWVVEPSFGWFNWCRRLSKDYEVLPQTSEAFIYVANIRLMLRRLA